MPVNDRNSHYNNYAPARGNGSRKRKRQRLLLIGAASLIIIAVFVILTVKGCAGAVDNHTNPANAVLSGTYVYDRYTEYEFDGISRGCMCLETRHYEFTYDIKGDTLVLDFDNIAVHDCSYTLTVNGSSITIVGGEGTTGGTYTLTKKPRRK